MTTLRLPQRRVMYTHASFWKRTLAFITDILIINIFLYAPFNTFFNKLPSTQELLTQGEQALPQGFFLGVSFLGLLALLYFALTEYYVGATPGMQLLKLRVGGKRTIISCLLRNIYALPFFPFTLLWIIEPIYLLIHKERLLEKLTTTTTLEQHTI